MVPGFRAARRHQRRFPSRAVPALDLGGSGEVERNGTVHAAASRPDVGDEHRRSSKRPRGAVPVQQPAAHRHPDVVGRRRGDPRVRDESRGDDGAHVRLRPRRAVEMHDGPASHRPDVSCRRAVDVGEPQRHVAPIHLRPALPVPAQDDTGRVVGLADRPDIFAPRAPEAGDHQLGIDHQLRPVALGVPLQQRVVEGAPDLSGRGDPHSEEVLALRETGSSSTSRRARRSGCRDLPGKRRPRLPPLCHPHRRRGCRPPRRGSRPLRHAVRAAIPRRGRRRDRGIRPRPPRSPRSSSRCCNSRLDAVRSPKPRSSLPPTRRRRQPRPCRNVVSIRPGTHWGCPVLRASNPVGDLRPGPASVKRPRRPGSTGQAPAIQLKRG